MIAKFEGWCPLCEDAIEPGAEINRYGEKYAHQECIELDAPLSDRDRRERATDRRFGFKRAR